MRVARSSAYCALNRRILSSKLAVVLRSVDSSLGLSVRSCVSRVVNETMFSRSSRMIKSVVRSLTVGCLKERGGTGRAGRHSGEVVQRQIHSHTVIVKNAAAHQTLAGLEYNMKAYTYVVIVEKSCANARVSLVVLRSSMYGEHAATSTARAFPPSAPRITCGVGK